MSPRKLLNREEKIELAEELAGRLTGIDRNEWKKWVEYIAIKRSIGEGIYLAQSLSSSPMLRERLQRTYSTIYRVIKEKEPELKSLAFSDQLEILGYVGRIMVARLARPLQGMFKKGRTKAKGDRFAR